MQSSDWTGGPAAINTLPHVPILGVTTIGADKCATCGVTAKGALLVGAISTDVGAGLLEEISQQDVFAGAAWSIVRALLAFIVGQQRCGTSAVPGRRQANAGNVPAIRTSAKTTAMNLKLRLTLRTNVFRLHTPVCDLHHTPSGRLVLRSRAYPACVPARL